MQKIIWSFRAPRLISSRRRSCIRLATCGGACAQENLRRFRINLGLYPQPIVHSEPARFPRACGVPLLRRLLG